MGLWNRVRSMFGADVSRDGYSLLQQIFPAGVPPRRGTRELLMAYRNMPWLHAAVHRVGEAIAGTQWRLYRSTSSSGIEQRRYAVKRDRAGKFASPGATEIMKHNALDLVRKPNPAIRRLPFWSIVQAYDDLKGEVPIVIERDTEGEPLELWPLPPHWLQFTPSAADPTYQFVWNAYRRRVPEADTLYLSRPDPENPYGRGCGNAEALADELDIDEFAAKNLAAFFYNRAMPDAFISLTGVKSEDKAKEWEERIRNKYRGSSRAWQFHVTSADLKVTTITKSFKDLQLQELREAQRDIVLQVFGVPPEIMGIVQNSNRATVTAADFIFTSKVLVPRLNYLADALTDFVQREWGEDLFFAYESPVAEDADFRLEVMTAQPSLFTKNEWRDLAELPPIDGWDDEFAAGTPGALPGAAPGETDPSQLPGGTAPALEPGDPTPDDPELDDDDKAEPTEERRVKVVHFGGKRRKLLRAVNG